MPVFPSNASSLVAYGDGTPLSMGTTNVSDALDQLKYYRASIFGTGSDGPATISTTVTLTKDMYYSDLTIASGGNLKPNGFKIFVSGTLDLTAAPASGIAFNGTNGHAGTATSGGSVTFASASGTMGANSSGIQGANGQGGTGRTGGSASSNMAMGGASNASGAGGAGSGGSGGPSVAGAARTAYIFGNTSTALRLGMSLLNGGAEASGGSGGGGDGVTVGGGGGGGGSSGGVIAIFARNINRGASTGIGCIIVQGGSGGNGGTAGGTNCGGGGGGAGGPGGWVHIVCESLIGTQVAQAIYAGGAPGGTGGGKTGTGVVGNGGHGGDAGTVEILVTSTASFSQSLGGSGGANTGQTAGSGSSFYVAL